MRHLLRTAHAADVLVLTRNVVRELSPKQLLQVLHFQTDLPYDRSHLVVTDTRAYFRENSRKLRLVVVETQ